MRRHFLKSGLAAAMAYATGLPSGNVFAATHPIRIGLTPVFLVQRAGLLNRWNEYLSQRIRRPVNFVLRQSYQEITTLLLSGQLDAAWICEYPYACMEKELRLLTTPFYQGKPLYRVYLIVPQDDKHTRSILDLKGRLFAFSDPNSLAGYQLPRYWLHMLGVDPDHFFERTIITWAHRNSVQAVADRLVDGAAVDGYVWDMLSRFSPEITQKTRIVLRSELYGFPPMVTPIGLPEREATQIRGALNGMNTDPNGQEILSTLGLQRFETVSPAVYGDVRKIATVMGC